MGEGFKSKDFCVRIGEKKTENEPDMKRGKTQEWKQEEYRGKQ